MSMRKKGFRRPPWPDDRLNLKSQHVHDPYATRLAAFDIPAGTTRLEAGVPKAPGAGDLRQAIIDFGQPGYGGPCLPKGHGTHRYCFRLLALDLDHLPVASRPHCHDMARAARPHVLATAELARQFRAWTRTWPAPTNRSSSSAKRTASARTAWAVATCHEDSP